MFIDGLYLIAILAAQCPEAITEVGDDYIIIDTKICKDIIEEIQNPFAVLKKDADSKIAFLLPLENEVETHEYPYVNSVKLSVHIARAHLKQDFKSSATCSFNYFHKKFIIQEGSQGRILLLYVFKTWMLYGRDYELGQRARSHLILRTRG